MSIFNISQTVGDIVTIMPKASDVFKKYNIDFCCGGNRPLGEAISEQKQDENEILEKLDEAYEETKKFTDKVDFRGMSRGELIDYIESTHHVFVKRILPEISQLTTKILRVHGPVNPELFKVHKLFHSLRTELEQHLIKEEEILFPLIKQYDRESSKELFENIKVVMKETEDEHETAGNVLKELRKVTEEYQVPENGCSTYCATYQKLQELEADLFQHIHLENNILFKEIGINIKD